MTPQPAPATTPADPAAAPPLGGLLAQVAASPCLARMLEIHRRGDAEVDLTAVPGVRPWVAAALAREMEADGGVVLLVTATGRESEDLAASLRSVLPPSSVAVFPSWETLPHERLSPRSDTVGQRLAVLRRLAHPGRDDHDGPVRVVIAAVRSLLQPIPTGLGDLEPVSVQAGQERGLEEVAQALVAAAYTRTDLVEKRGEFAVRGGILDVFPPTEDHPLRLEFWGDEVEEVRWFRVADQRSLEVAPGGLWAPPCRELLLTPEVRERAARLAPELPGVADMLEAVAAGVATEGMESLTPVLVDGMETLLDVLPAGSRLLVSDPERIRRRAADLVTTSQEFLTAGWSSAAAGGQVPVDLAAALGEGAYRELAQIREHALETTGWWALSPFAPDLDTLDDDATHLRLDAEEVPNYRGEPDRAVTDVRAALAAGRRVVLLTDGPGLAKRLAEVLGEAEVGARLVVAPGPEGPAGVAEICTASWGPGVSLPSVGQGLVVVSEQDLTGQAVKGSTKDMRRMPSRRRKMVDPLQLNPGDFIVHEQHGVGRFVEMVQRQVGGATREYLVVEYASSKRGQPADRLFVPTDQLDQITRYVGGEAPTLNKLGGSDWSKTKSRARKHVKEIANELIQLYSARMATQGHAFAPDSPWQRELEDAFAYVETPDQLSTIDEVKADMEKSVPMDRLLCGDVGYGKTEIAVRAAFKAIQDSKQVAVLVPTTLLVQQHLQTFSERYQQFPVTVRALSRFTPDSEVEQTLEGLKDGSVDLVIGTHRLLSPSVRFKDLGLVIIDEEQRFGVEHKEQLKTLRTAVDVLAMSATPIPRTLEMAVTGIREMSTLATPPEERHPVLTYVGAYEEKQIAAAIHRELLREGQVFFVHNKVATIDKVAARLRELVPEARVEVAHGQMGEHRLEQVVTDFWERKFDVLVSTTIVETGLDIANANTLILDRADTFGLSQLHQLRGRVGRGRERAYAYFLYPPEKPLTETAHDRLRTIASHTDLGAGMQVAMKDLEIRGAGNLLGGEQSGHIAGVGFDLYVRMVGEAVARAKEGDEGDGEPTEIKVELPVDAHLPHDYVPGERLRLEVYKKLAAVRDDAELDDIVAEVTDRYGTPPQPVEALFAVARLRTLARRAGVAEISAMGSKVRFAPVELRESQELRLLRMYPGTVVKPALGVLLVPTPKTAKVGGQPLRDAEVLEWAGQLLRAVLLDDIAQGQA